MGSRNAFASQLNGHSNQTNNEHEQGDNARSSKRIRLSDEVIPTFLAQDTDPETSLEVDHMILDYIAYNTINSCLASRNAEKQRDVSQSLSNNIAMSNAFMSIFRARHQTYRPDPELRLRVLLLKLTTLFTQRLTSNPTTPPRTALAELRIQNTDRARTWIGSADRMPSATFNTDAFDNDLPVSLQELERNRAHVLNRLEIPAEDDQYEDAFYGTSSCVSLLDLLPLFMEVLAARNAMSGSNLTTKSMNLVCNFMMQACLEQYLVFGADGTDALDESFAWGYEPSNEDEIDDAAQSDRQQAQKEVNDMFEDEDYMTEVSGWASLRHSYLNDLATIGPDARDGQITTHLEQLAFAHPIEAFDNSILEFLGALSNSIPEPVLVQLEKGKMDGISAEETKSFLADCGVTTARFFERPVGFKGVRD